MHTCSECGRSYSVRGSDAGLCPDCLRKRLSRTWGRQMRFYGTSCLLGLVLLVYVVWQARTHQQAMGEHSMLWAGLAALGGLALLGGLFGLALAVFFHYWHRRKKG